MVIVGCRLWDGQGLVPGHLVVEGRSIGAVLTGAAVRPPRGDMLLDARGAVLVPGFVDAHLHLTALARRRVGVDLSAVVEPDGLVGALAGGGSLDGGWRLGWGAVPGVWRGRSGDWGRALDRAFPDEPVLAVGFDLHSGLANGAARRRLAGACGGEGSGLIEEQALWRALEGLPWPVGAELAPWLRSAVDGLFAQGVTSVLDFDGAVTCAALDEVAAEGAPLPRVLSALRPEDALRSQPKARWGRGGFRGEGPRKLFADGSLGSATAALDEPYEGSPDRGVALLEGDELVARIREADAVGRTVAVHAIGDRAAALVMDAFEVLGKERCRRMRHRIEHAQILPPGGAWRMRALGLAATVIPSHLRTDAAAGLRLLGPDRLPRLHPIANLVAAGVPFALTSDAPVQPANPLELIRWAGLRSDGSSPPCCPEQRIDGTTALRAVTAGGAWLLFGEGRFGRLAPGLAADLVLLSGDPRDVESPPPSVLLTMVGGVVAHAASGVEFRSEGR